MNKFRADIPKILWTFPLFLIFGYVFTAPYFENTRFDYLAYNILAIVSYIALLIGTTSAEKKYLAVLIGLLSFIFLYIFRFYWITIDPIPVREMLPTLSWQIMTADKVTLLEAFRFSVISFTAWCIAVITSLFLLRNKGRSVEGIEHISCIKLRPIVPYLLLFIVLSSGVFAYISAYYHIGEMGAIQVGEPLPFHLKGVIFYIRTICIPIGFLVLIYLAEKVSLQNISRIGMVLLLAFAVLDMLLRNSRSPLLLALLLLLFLVVSGGMRFSIREKILFVLVTALSFMMVPMMKVYRGIRITENLSYLDALGKAVDIVEGNLLGQIFEGVKFILFRMPGIESLWAMLSLNAKPILEMPVGSVHFNDGIAGYLSHGIHGAVHAVNGIAWSSNSLMAPGFIGWWYLVAGVSGVLIGALLIGMLSVVSEKYFLQHQFLSGPVPRVVFYWMLFMALTEGTLDYMIYMFLVAVITVIFFEMGLRVLTNYFIKSESLK